MVGSTILRWTEYSGVGVQLQDETDDVQAKLQKLRTVYAQAVEMHKTSAGSVRRELERVMNDLTSEIRELERKLQDGESASS
jgi:uncharacterized coiled-coil DUF342 family protein